MAFLLIGLLWMASPASADADAPFDIACADATLANVSDATASVVLPFSVNLGGSALTDTMYISENGHLTFESEPEPWFPANNFFFLTNEEITVIAPLYADASQGLNGAVSYGATTFEGNDAFCVNWTDLEPRTDTGGPVPDPMPTNSFQVVLIERADRGVGAFDIVTNYESIGWATTYCGDEFCAGFFDGNAPEDGMVAALPGVAFPYLDAEGRNIYFEGAQVVDEMIDPAGLSATSLNADQAGRHIVEIEGLPSGSVAGRVLEGLDDAIDGTPIADALVWVCTDEEELEIVLDEIFCATTQADADGNYQIDDIPFGWYVVTARPPAGSDLIEDFDYVFVDSTGVNEVNVYLYPPPPPPAPGVTISPTLNWGDGPTTVYYQDDINLSVTGCVGGTAMFAVYTDEGDYEATLTEGPDGTYTAVIPALFPASGDGFIDILVECPEIADNEYFGIPLYIDPSGTVLEVHSGEPIDGATVVLERRDNGDVPFAGVPDGSIVMSPKNRQNPFTTSADGLFGWDVSPGEYRVNVSKDGCDTIALPTDWADRVLTNVDDIVGVPDASVTPVLKVRPEWLGLELFLDCNNEPTFDDLVGPDQLAPITLDAPVQPLDLPIPNVSDLDPDDAANLVITSFPQAQDLPVGITVVEWTAIDEDGGSATAFQTVTVVGGAIDDADGDGVLDADDACPGTVLPDLDPADVASDRLAADADGVFVAGPDGPIDMNPLTIADTRGCSGLQILDLVVVSPDFNEATTGLRLSTIKTWIFECSADAGALSWTDEQQVKYWIYQSLDNGATFTFAGSTTGATTFDVPNAVVGALYQVHYPGIGRVACDIVSEPDPGSAPFTCASDAGVLTWSDSMQPKYWVYRSLDGGATYTWLGRTLGEVTFTNPDPVMGALYQVHYAGIPRTDCTIVSEPANASAFACTDDFGELSWSDRSQNPYWVYKSVDGGATYVWIGRTTGATTFSDPAPSEGDLYQVHYAGIPRVDCLPAPA